MTTTESFRTVVGGQGLLSVIPIGKKLSLFGAVIPLSLLLDGFVFLLWNLFHPYIFTNWDKKKKPTYPFLKAGVMFSIYLSLSLWISMPWSPSEWRDSNQLLGSVNQLSHLLLCSSPLYRIAACRMFDEIRKGFVLSFSPTETTCSPPLTFNDEQWPLDADA